MALKDLIKAKQKDILSIAAKYGATNIRLFGSVAKNTSTKSSDVDFLIEMVKGATLLDIIAIKQDLEDLLGAKVDVVTIHSLSPYIKEEVLKEAVNL